MSIGATMVAGVIGLLLASVGLAAEPGGPSLVDAAKQGDRDAVRALLDQGTKADAATADGTTALMWAVSRDDLEIADLLLRAGADATAANEYGATPLYVAATNAHADMTVKLLAAGADPNAPLISGETPLMEAARRGKLAMVRSLLSGGADPNARETNGGQAALMWAVSERHSDVTEELVRQGADIHATSKRGFTALMFAAQQGDTNSARILLAAGARPNDVMPKTNVTPLIVASAMGHGDIAEMLLSDGADPDAVDGSGFTSLHHAVWGKRALAIVRTLLAHGANPNVRLQDRRMAAASGVALEGATPLALAAEINNLNAVKALVSAGADPLIGTEQNTTPLILAAGGGTDLARPRSPEERATALETVTFLVARGADVNAAGQFGWTALHAAAYQGLNEVIEFLASEGARLDTMDGFGQTALSISYAVLTRDIGDAYYQTPRVFRQDTADLLLNLGATPLERSGVVVGVIQRTP